MYIFADDVELFTTDPESLQRQLNNIYDYSCKWGLTINVSKTKVCVFEVRKSNCNFRWSINDEYSDIVDEFCYLGVKLHYTGNLARVIKSLNN